VINFNFQTITGFYVGAREVYIAQVKGTLLGLRLVKFGKADIQASAQTAELTKARASAIVQAIKRVVQENNITDRKVISALPGKDVLIRYFQMPRIPRSEWDTAVKFEAKKYIPFKLEELIWDFHVVLHKARGTKMSVTFVAVKKEVAEAYISLLEEAGLQPLSLEPAPFSLLRLFTLSKQLTKDKPIAILDVDYGLVDINIVKNKVCYLTRDVSLPLEKEVIFDTLLNEIRMSLDYYEKIFPAEVIGKLLLAGEVELNHWEKMLAEELKLPVEKADLAGIVRVERTLPSLNMAIPIALALRGLTKTAVEVNLYQVRKVKPKAAVTKEAFKFTPGLCRTLFRAIAISCIGLLILHMALLRRVTQERRRLGLLISLRPKVDLPVSVFSSARLDEKKKELENKLSTLKLIIVERIFLTDKFNELPKIIPPGVWLTNLSFSDKSSGDGKIARTLNISGVAYHKDSAQEIEIISKFVSNLKGDEAFSRGFKEIKLGAMSSSELKGILVKRFTIACSF